MIGDRLLRLAHHGFVLLLVVASTVVLSAQTVVDPRYVEFTPSTDHNTLATDGTPLVQRYSLSIFPVGSSVATDTMDLGKPAPSGGIIRVDFLPLLHVTLTPGVVFEARVNAVGPGGSTASSASNGFTFQAACAPAINSSGQSVGSGGGTGSVGVTAGTGCTWSAVSNANWITLTGATSGTGNGSVPYSVAANPSTSARSGTLTVAGQTYTVSQAALACSYSLSSSSQSVAAGGGTGSTNVTAPSGCGWTGVSNHPSWLTVTSGASGNGNGTVAFSASSNPNTSARTGTIAIGGQTFSVVQAATSCTYALVPTSQSFAASGGTSSTTVTALAGCAWTGVSNNTPWLTITNGASGSGGGTVAFSVASNPNGTQRNGTLTIAGQTFSVTQAAAPCTYSLSPPSQAVAVGGGTGSTTVTSPAGCAWTGVSNNTGWLTVTGGASGSGNGTVSFSASANASTTQRSGTITVGGQTFTVTQPGVTCTYSISPTSQVVGASSATGSTSVTAPAGCAWTGVSNNTSWLTVTSGASGSGPGTVAFSAAANAAASPRTGTLTIGGQTFTVAQDRAGCSFSISPSTQSVPAAGGNVSTTVTATSGCSWTAASSATWIAVTTGATGSGNGSVTFSVAPSPSAGQRWGTLTIAGHTFTVTQAANTCSYVLTPASTTLTATGGTGSIAVATTSGCTWAATTTQAWITVSGTATASGTATYTVAPNTGTSRVGAVSIGTQVFTVIQDAPATGCSYSLSPTSQSVAAAGGTGSTTVTAPAGCAWTGVSSNTSWLTVTSGASGSGGGTVAFNAAANTSASSRSGTLTIGGQTFTVTQPAAGCTFTLTPTSRTIAAGASTMSTSVTAPSGCSWTAVSNNASWLTVTSGATGTGNGTVSLSATANTGTQPRAGTATIGGQTFSVTQDAGSCSFSISPSSQSVPGAGGTGSTTVTTATGCNWTAVSNASWITVTTGATGSSSGSVSFTIAPSTSTAQRFGTLTIAGRTYTITQAANTCSYVLAPTSTSLPAAGGAGNIAVTAAAGCTWAASTTQTWITVSGTSTSSGTATYTVAPNSGSSRVGAISIGTKVFTVVQAAGTTLPSSRASPASPAGLRITGGGGSE